MFSYERTRCVQWRHLVRTVFCELKAAGNQARVDTFPRSSAAHLEPASRSRLCCTTDAAGLMLGVAQRDALRSHWSSSFSSSSSVGPPASAEAHTCYTAVPALALDPCLHETYPCPRSC